MLVYAAHTLRLPLSYQVEEYFVLKLYQVGVLLSQPSYLHFLQLTKTVKRFNVKKNQEKKTTVPAYSTNTSSLMFITCLNKYCTNIFKTLKHFNVLKFQ